MVYRSSRRPPANEDEAEELENFSLDTDEDKENKVFQQAATWKKLSIFLTILCLCLLIGIIVLGTNYTNGDQIPECGSRSSSVKRVIDLSEPDNPGPFHDLTKQEIRNVLSFLSKDSSIKLKPINEAKTRDATVYMMDLLPAKKAEIQDYLSGKRPQPDRQARVILFRRDLNPAMIHELACGPLPHVKQCPLLKSSGKRNPIEYSLRPIGFPPDMIDMSDVLFPKIEKQIGHILRESFGASLTNCEARECLKFYPAPMGTNISGDVTSRRMWLGGRYNRDYYVLNAIDFGMLANFDSVDPKQHFISKIWYHGQFFKSVDDFVQQYAQNRIQKVKSQPPAIDPKDSFSSLYRRGDPLPETPQRPPALVEPDGKRYSVKNREVDYLGWKFNFRMSPLSGPVINNIRYQGDRIAYEISMSDMAVLYSAFNPVQQMCDYSDSGALLGMMSRSLVPGADCPETATFISQTFPSQTESEPNVYKRGFCLFENNMGHPLRRHLSPSEYEGHFYGGMLDSALILRSILTVINYDYVIDFIFYQSGAVQTRIMSTGYIIPSFYNPLERPYGWETHKDFLAPIHHHLFHFKVDLDISGTSNRYETLDIKPEKVILKEPPNQEYNQMRFDRSLKTSEKEALYKFDFDKPKYHIVHNSDKKTDLNQPKAYRIHMNGMSKFLAEENKDNEISFSWARHQLVVTKQKDDEAVAGSPYALFDSRKPVTNFTRFYEDNEDIVDEDLVFWITSGVHHIPHTEDLPVTPTVGAHIDFFLLPYNYFPSCPSFHSRDHVFVNLKDKRHPEKGLLIDRHGNKDEQCKTSKHATAYDELINKEPDILFDL